MKILYVITKSNWGGAQKYVFELATAAALAGHNVQVACGGTGLKGAKLGKLATKLASENIPVAHIKNFQRDMSALNDIKAGREIYHLIKKFKPDVVHTTSSKAGGLGSLAARICLTKKIIFSSHGLTMDEIWRPVWQRALIYISTWLTLALAHKSIMISTETFQRASAMPGLAKKIVLIFNGIKPVNFLEKTQAKLAIAPNLPLDSIWIGGVGELHPNKNWSSAILALNNLPSTIHLLIIGQGEEETKLKNLITDNKLEARVHLLGYLEAAQYLKAFDLFILPSLKEGLPYVLLEAGLASLPTIASNLPGNHDIIENNISGFLIEPTPNKIATTVSEIITNPTKSVTLGKNLKQTIQTKFSPDEMYKKTLALYANTISSE